MDNSISRNDRIAALALIALGVALRLWIHTPTDLWEDEIIATTHAVQPFWMVIVDSIRNDVHPPLYFLQLHVWGWLGHSDLWFIFNSVAWGFAALLSIWIVAGRLWGPRAGLFAAAVLAVVPTAIYMSDQIRMYAMLTTLLIWSFYLCSCVFGAQQRTAGWLIGHALLLIAILNIHAISTIAVLCNGVYALYLVRTHTRDRRGLVIWLLTYGLAAVCALPWLVSGMMHDANLGNGGGIGGVIASLATSTIGLIANSPLLVAVGVAAYGTLAWIGLSSPRTRALTWIFLLLPIGLSAIVGLAYKPVFKWNFFSAMEAPFIALIAALVLDERATPLRVTRTAATALVASFCVIGAATQATVIVSTGFRDKAALIAANYRPGDIVFIPQQSFFWGMAWYLGGPDWGSPFAVAAPPSPQWQGVYRHLGPRLVRTLHLMPDTQLLDRNGFRILTGNDSAPQAQGATRIWLLTGPRADLKPGYPPEMLDGLPQQWSDHNHVWATLYAAGAQTVTAPKQGDASR